MSVVEDAPGPTSDSTARPPSRWIVPIVIVGLVVAMLASGQYLLHRSMAGNDHRALASSPKGVAVAEATSAMYRATRRYVGTIEPWIEARVGSQLVSAYVATVLVRPGAIVHRGDVLATLDCREASASNSAVALQARAIAASQAALARQASRVTGLLDGGFVAQNEVDQRQAEVLSEQARLQATQARLAGSNLVVSDCVMRAPFDGEISARMIDPGAFIHPGAAVVAEVDRSTVRVATDVPETDFAIVAPGTPVRLHLLATDRRLNATVTRRSPAADPSTRTVRVEIDVTEAAREMPVNTTAEMVVDVGQAVAATEIPLIAADVRGTRANVFVVQDGVAHARTVAVLGESGGSLFVAPTLAGGARVVTDGRSMLTDGDRVTATLTPRSPAPTGEPHR